MTVVLHLIILRFSGDKDPPIRWSVAPGRTLPYLSIIQRGIEMKRFSILKLLSRRWSFFKSNLGDISFPPCDPIFYFSLQSLEKLPFPHLLSSFVVFYLHNEDDHLFDIRSSVHNHLLITAAGELEGGWGGRKMGGLLLFRPRTPTASNDLDSSSILSPISVSKLSWTLNSCPSSSYFSFISSSFPPPPPPAFSKTPSRRDEKNLRLIRWFTFFSSSPLYSPSKERTSKLWLGKESTMMNVSFLATRS